MDQRCRVVKGRDFDAALYRDQPVPVLKIGVSESCDRNGLTVEDAVLLHAILGLFISAEHEENSQKQDYAEKRMLDLQARIEKTTAEGLKRAGVTLGEPSFAWCWDMNEVHDGISVWLYDREQGVLQAYRMKGHWCQGGDPIPVNPVAWQVVDAPDPPEENDDGE